MGEILLWKQLRAGSIMGYRFNRQKPLNNYIVDFYCKHLKLVIEVDGGYHFEEAQMIKDKKRQTILEQMRLHFLRFHDEEVRKDMLSVIAAIKNRILQLEKREMESIA